MSQVKNPTTRSSLATLRIDRTDGVRHRSFLRRLARFLVWLVLLVAVLAGGLALANQQGWLSLAELITPRTEVRVGAVQVQTGRSGDALVVATGYLESRRQAKIGAKAPGRIQFLHVEEGSRVTAGQELAVLEHADMDAGLAAANAVLRRTKAELGELEIQIAQNLRQYERRKKLRESGRVSENDYEQAMTNYEVSVAHADTLRAAVALSEARVQEARQLVENMYVRAPFDGTVISTDAEVGESILPGGMGEASGRGSVVTIADLENLEVDTDVKEDYISRTSVGQPAEILVDAVPDKRYVGRVRKIIPMGDRARATIKVKVEVVDVDERLFPNMSCTVYFLPTQQDEKQAEEQSQRRLFCPKAAVQTNAQGQYVWVVDTQDQVQLVPVSVGTERDGRVEVESGLNGGERVVLDPSSELKEGQQVRVAD